MRLPPWSLPTDFESTAIRSVSCLHVCLVLLYSLAISTSFLVLILHQQPLMRRASLQSNSGVTHHSGKSSICAFFLGCSSLLPALALILVLILLELKHKSLCSTINNRALVQARLLDRPAGTTIREDSEMLDVRTIRRVPLDTNTSNSDTRMASAIHSMAIGTNAKDPAFGKVRLCHQSLWI